MSGLQQQQHQERQESQPHQQRRLRLAGHRPRHHHEDNEADRGADDDEATAEHRWRRRIIRRSDASHRASQSQRHPAVGLLVLLLAAAPLLLLIPLRQQVVGLPSWSPPPSMALVHAFCFTSYGGRIAPGFRSSASAVAPLHMGRKGRGGGAGKLGDLVDLAATTDPPTSTTPSTTKSRRTTKSADSSSKKKTKASSSATASGGGISPLLAQWAAETSTSTSTSSQDVNVVVVDDDAASSTSAVMSNPASPSTSLSSRSSSNSRRERQSQRQQAEREREELVQRAVHSIRAMLSDDDDDSDDEDNKTKKAPFRVESLLEQVQELVDLPQSSGTNLRQLTVGSQSYDYRLAWVGSDEAMCELGTGLHKVKLARLQEVFMTLGPKNRVQMYEVIRILGPFPNVKNTLVGKSVLDSKSSSRSTQPWRITWQSLIDGTGKEILAGTKVRHVDLQVLWCDKNLVVCSTGVTTNTDSKEGPADVLLNNGGRYLFVFIKEDRMESKLDALRVI